MNLTTTGKIAVALLIAALLGEAYYLLGPKIPKNDTAVSDKLSF